MNQDDIYNLLLILLLMSNERGGNDNPCNSNSTRGSINELIIASMLLNSCNTRDGCPDALSDGCGRIRRGDNTTF